MKKAVAVADFAWVLPGDFSWSDLLAGRSAVVRLPDEFPVAVGAPCPLEASKPKDWQFGMFPRVMGLAKEALDRLDAKPKGPVGLVLGMPNYHAEFPYLQHVLDKGESPDAMTHVSGYYADAALHYMADRIPHCGPRVRLDAACATGNDCLITAGQWLEAGVISDCLVIAASAMLTPMGLALFKNLKAVNTQDNLEASCPFDRRRRGFVMGEGAAAFWLTTRPEITAKGYLRGYGQRLHAENFIDLPKDIEPMVAACRDALGDAHDIAYVSAHGTATQLNDLRETQLHRELFGQRADQIPLSSVKSMLGHTLGAAALIDAAVCLAALEHQIAPPTINLHEPDPLCDLNYVPNQAQTISGEFALSHAFAFGGQQTSVLFSRSLS